MYKTIRQPLAQIVGLAATRVPVKLSGGVYHRKFAIRASCTIQISVANATNVRNKGSAFSIWDFIGITGGGEGDRIILDGRSLRAIAEAYAPSLLSATRLTSPNIATVNLVEEAVLFLAYPGDADPHATTYIRKNKDKDLYFFAQLRGDGGGGGLVTAGGATVAVTNPILAVEEIYDDATTGKPDFIPQVRQDLVQVKANGQQPIYYITSGNHLRAMLIQQDTDQGEVNDILTALAIRSRGRDIIGPGQVAVDDLQRAQESEFGGLVYATGTGPSATGAAIGSYLFFNFVENGRLSNMIAAGTQDLRLDFSANTSGQANVTQSNLRFTFLENEYDAARCKPVGKQPGQRQYTV